jgi:transposase
VSNHASAYQQMIDRETTKVLGAIPLILPFLEKLGLREIINQTLVSVNDVDNGTVGLVLCLNRLLAPRPLYRVEEWLGETVLPETLGLAADKLNDDRLGRFLDDLAPHLEGIWQTLCLRAIEQYRVDLSVLLYDLTSVYFEGEYADNSAVTYGYSRDQRSDCKQRVIGLNVSGLAGVPILYQLLAGNTTDCTTPQANLTRLRSFLNLLPQPPRWPSLVSDQVLVSADVFVRAHQQEIFLLGPLDSRLTVHQHLLAEISTEELRQHPLAYRAQHAKPTDPVPYFGIVRPFSFSSVIDGQEVSVDGQVLVVLSESKAKLDREHRQAQITKLERALAEIASKLNQRRYKKRDYILQRLAQVQQGNAAKRLFDVALNETDGQFTLTYALNGERLAQEEAQDGKYLIGTTNLVLTEEQIFARSKLRDRIEKRIGVVKGPLRVRPLFVQTETRIQGLVFLTLVALLIFSLLELELARIHRPQTARAALDTFASLGAVDLVFRDGSQVRRLSNFSPHQAELLDLLGLPAPHTYLTMHLLTC